MSNSPIVHMLTTFDGVIPITIAFIALAGMLLIVRITNLPILQLINKFIRWVGHLFSKAVDSQERSYRRDIAIGKLDEQRKTVKLYRFLNDLIIDLGWIQTGITPFELLWIVIFIVFVVATIICKLLFDSMLMTLVMTPIAVVGTFCVMYTKANIAHDERIESVIEAENIICNNIKVGVVVAVRDSLTSIPKSVRPYFKDFLDNVENENYHIKTALQELNGKLGGIADDFIKKCIVFETEEEHGIAGMFSDIVEMNNITSEMRQSMKRKFEEVKNQFIIGATMIFGFLAGVLVIYPDIRTWYFTSLIGRVLLSLDLLALIGEFVFITWLRAQEL